MIKHIRSILLYCYPLRYMVIKDIKSIALKNNIANVLDYGVGNGTYKTHIIESIGCVYTGVDVYLNANVDYHVSDFINVSETYDLIICLDVLQHCADPIEVLSLLKSKMHNNSILYITFPFLYPICDFKDYWRWTSQGFELLCAQSNLSTIKYKPRGGVLLLFISTVVFALQKVINGKFKSWNKRMEPNGKILIFLAFVMTFPLQLLSNIAYLFDSILPNTNFTIGYRYIIKNDNTIN